MKRLFFLLVIFIVFIDLVEAQIFIDKGFNEERLQFRVKQLDEFIKRFNYEIDIEGNKVTKSDVNTRRLYILSLIDENLTNNKVLTKKELKRFDDFIVSSANDSLPVKLSFYDKNWYAEASCKVYYKGKEQNLKLVLKTETDSKNNSHWIIVSAYSDFMSIIPTEINEDMFLSPVDNELNFMSLPIIIKNNKKDIVNYAGENYLPSHLEIFFWLTKTGQLEIKYTEKITYHFLQVPNFIFTVNHFERNSDNVGWLISNIIRTDKKQKQKYLRQKLFLIAY